MFSIDDLGAPNKFRFPPDYNKSPLTVRAGRLVRGALLAVD
jgi:hypothetical protein